MRRGFKAEAESYALEFRQELGRSPSMPLCPWKLADHLAIPVYTLSHFLAQEAEAVNILKTSGRNDFSAITLMFGNHKRFIIHNDAHHPNRQRSNIAHELSHGILGHPATPPLNEHGCRHYNRGIEEEANHLSGTLLVPRAAALNIVSRKIPLKEAAEEYGVSLSLLRWRINDTGVNTQINRRMKRF